MKRRNFLCIGILVAFLMLAVGYAAISSIPLNITGTASAQPDDSSFVVKFDSDVDPTATSSLAGATVSAAVTGDRNATLSVSGLTTKGQTATFVYTVKNESLDLAADISETSAAIGQSGDVDYSEYFSVDVTIQNSNIAAEGSTTVTVVVTLEKTPVDENPTAAVTVTLSASVAS